MPRHEQLRRHRHLGTWSWDPVGKSASWSEALCRLFGLDPQDLLLSWKEHRKFFVSDSFEKLEESFTQCIETGLSYVIDLEAIHLTGKILHLEVHGAAECNDKGEAVTLSGVMIDRTAQAHSGKALKISNDQFSSAFQYASAGMALVSLEGKWIRVNPSLLKMLGYTEEELLEKTFQEITHPGDLEEDLENGRRLFAGEIISFQMEKRYFHKSGSIVWVLLSVSLAHNADGSPLHFIAQIQDISEEREKQRILQEVSEKALSADRAKGEFLAVMSHELRTPLNGILGAADLILGDPGLPAETYDKADIILSSGKGLLVLLEEILDYSQIERGGSLLLSGPFSLSEVAWEVIRLMESSALAKSLPLEVHLDQNLPLTVRGDALRIRQVLTNLVRNAVKFTESGVVKLSIRSEVAEEGVHKVRFDVEDTGPGIPDDQHERIFLPFTQADSSLSRKYGGTGLGLAISRNLVEQMGGTLKLESQVGRGSLFTFDLALPLATSVKVEEKNRTMNLGDLDDEFAKRFPVRILAVDDEATNLKLLVRLLGKLGYEKVLTASHGEEALQIFGQESMDLVFMDLQMPGIDGLAATQKIRALEESGTKSAASHRTFIVALTANVNSSVRSKCLQGGMNHYISKPFNTRSLAEAIAMRAS